MQLGKAICFLVAFLNHYLTYLLLFYLFSYCVLHITKGISKPFFGKADAIASLLF